MSAIRGDQRRRPVPERNIQDGILLIAKLESMLTTKRGKVLARRIHSLERAVLDWMSRFTYFRSLQEGQSTAESLPIVSLDMLILLEYKAN